MKKRTNYCIVISATHLMDCECQLTYPDLFNFLNKSYYVEDISKLYGSRVYFKADPENIDYIRAEFDEMVRELFPASAAYYTIIKASFTVKTRKEESEEGLQR